MFAVKLERPRLLWYSDAIYCAVRGAHRVLRDHEASRYRLPDVLRTDGTNQILCRV